MQTLPNGWDSARNGIYKYETIITIAGTEYTETNIYDLRTTASLYSQTSVSVGGCVSKEIDLSLLPVSDVPRMAEIKVYIRPVSESAVGEWLPKGTFYIDTRSTDKTTGLMTIHGYDAMLMMERIYVEDGEDVTGWPKTMDVVAADIANKLGLEIDARTDLIAYSVEAPVGYTMREVMGWIAAAHGGNWTITDAGKLRLVPLYSTTMAEALRTGYLVDEDGNAITFGGVRIIV